MYRRIRLENPKIKQNIAARPGAMGILCLAGFVREKLEDENDKNGGDLLVYRPKNRQANALELYLEEVDNGDGQEPEYDHPLQRELIQAICQKIDAKARELEVTFGLKNPAPKSKAKDIPDPAPSAASSTVYTSQNSPFLSEEERLLRQQKIKAMKKAKRQAQAATLQRWEESKQEKKVAAERREATFHSNINVEAEKGAPQGVTIKNQISKQPLPLAKPMEPAPDLEQQMQSMRAAARDRHKKEAPSEGEVTPMNVAAPAPAPAPMSLSNWPGPAPTQTTPRLVAAASASTAIPVEDQKPAAPGSLIEKAEATKEEILQWEQFLETVPRCASAEGIRESSCFNGTMQDQQGMVPTKCLKRLFKEFDGLKDTLPSNSDSSIWLRFDEESPQYIRAVMVAAIGITPYSGGLFAFDIYVPAIYPQEPPKIKLISRGGRSFSFGPNLYSDGGVCLSLLWGSQGGSWIPGHSSLHQVLISIQGLMLGVEHPYYLMRGGWQGRVKEGDFTHIMGRTLAGKAVAGEVGIDPLAVLAEDKIRVGTIMFAMLDPIASCAQKKEESFWTPFHAIIEAHFRRNRMSILLAVRTWLSDQVMGRNRQASVNAQVQAHNHVQEGGLAVDEIGKLLPKLELRLTRMSLPGCAGSAEMEPDSAPAEVRDFVSDDGDDKVGIAAAIPDPNRNNMAATKKEAKEAEIVIEETEQMKQTRQRMRDAGKQGEYVRAGHLQQELKRLEQVEREKIELQKRLDRLKGEMEEAAEQEDFIRAGRLQAQIKALTAVTTKTSQRAPQEHQVQNDDSDDDVEGDAEGGNLAEAMANHPEFAGAMAQQANAPTGNGQQANAPKEALTGRQSHGLGKNVFAPPGYNEHITDPNYEWGTSGTTLRADPITSNPERETRPPAQAVEKKKSIPEDQRCRLRIRLPSKKSVVEEFDKTEPLIAVYARISELMADSAPAAQLGSLTGDVSSEDAPAGTGNTDLFTLLLTHPRLEFDSWTHGTSSLEELNLAPSATLTVGLREN
ncbi:IAP repeat-containing protein 6 [Seminavis robusta]|uniref:IAP repeat-containing protein 6 n=1 Tax=Seminavis robusta TaxID=568900 RepID=A0A9N8EES1_9STRA|nr:IAP repeat-containing protein 6 [Seminavis robusta]|eukprot:Sro1077_g238680.1 IAP repeat-containing protein 6 (1011) ;mRNA; r:29256-32288